MDYQRIYNQLIERAQNRTLEGYKEKHHILPKCLGGEDNKENLVELTAREHFLCHMLLCEIYPKITKLWYALFLMSIGKQKIKNNKFVASSRTYERVKKEWLLKVKGRKKPKNFMSDELKSKISKSNKGVSRNLGRKMGDDVKEKMSNSKKGKKFTQTHIDNLKIGIQNRKPWVKNNYKVVEQYNLKGELLNTFKSSNEASEFIGKNSQSIADCCRGRQKTAYGFIWMYKI